MTITYTTFASLAPGDRFWDIGEDGKPLVPCMKITCVDTDGNLKSVNAGGIPFKTFTVNAVTLLSMKSKNRTPALIYPAGCMVQISGGAAVIPIPPEDNEFCIPVVA